MSSPFRSGSSPAKPVEVGLVLNWGGMGDMIARMPAIQYASKRHKHVTYHVFVYDYLYELFTAAMPDIKIYKHSDLESFKENNKIPMMDFQPMQISSSKPHLTEYAFLMVEFRTPPQGNDWNYLQVPNLSTNIPDLGTYGVLCTGYTAPVREWPAKEAYDTAQWMVDNGITPVYLGKASNALTSSTSSLEATLDDAAIHPQGVDLRGTTSLLEALELMSKAKFVAGPDCGLLHLASMSDVPTIWGFTSIDPWSRLPFRHGSQTFRTLAVGQPPTLECRYCQTHQNLVYTKESKHRDHDYKTCLYKDYLCTKNLTAAQFIGRIKEIIGHKGPGAAQPSLYKGNK